MQTTEATTEATTESVKHDALFEKTCVEFMTSLCAVFPDNQDLSMAQQMMGMVPSNMKRITWAEFTKPIVEAIMRRDIIPVLPEIEKAGGLVQKMDIGLILMDPNVPSETKATIWKFVQLMTLIAHRDTGVVVPPPSEGSPPVVATPTAPTVTPTAPAVTPTAPAVTPAVAAPTPAAPAPAAPAPDIGKIVEGFANAMPQVLEAVNTQLEKNNGDNMLAKMFRQYMDPNAVEPGVLNNMAASALQGVSPNVMSQVQKQMENASADDILQKLAELEKLKKAQARSKRR